MNSVDDSPEIPFVLVKELADLLRWAVESLEHPGDEWEHEAELALEDYRNTVALNG